MKNRSYSVLEIRTVDDDKRIIRGIATTPQQARDGDVLETSGIQFKLPIPFLWRHRDEFGNVTAAKVTPEGIEVEIQVGPAGIAQDIDERWRKIKAGLVRGLSIGWRTIAEIYDKEIAGYRILKSEWLELSAVPVPADTGAMMTAVRSASEEDLERVHRERQVQNPQPAAAPGAPQPPTPPAVPGKPTRQRKSSMKSFAEQIRGQETRLAEVRARMNELLTAATDGIFSAEQAEESREFDTLSAEQETINTNLKRLRAMDDSSATAVPAEQQQQQRQAPSRPAPSRQAAEVVGPKLEKGIPFARMAIALFAAKGDRIRAAQYVENNPQWMGQTPELARILRAAVALGDTLSAGWAAELTPLQNYTADFVEFLRPQTIIGKINGFKMVPFRVSIKVQDDGTEGDWVGEGSRKPLGKLSFDTIELKQTKVAKIVAMTEDAVRFSTPSLEMLVRQDLANGLALAMDRAFISESNAGIANIKPASVLYGAQHDSASGTDYADLVADVKAAFAQFTGNDIPLSGLAWVMQESQAVGLSLMQTALGNAQFPGMSVNGGTLFGFPVATSQIVNSGVVGLIKPSEILMADDGVARVDMSNQATLIMDDGGSPSATNAVNLWQENAVGIRAERFINWKLRRPVAAYYITGADYGS